MADFNRSTTYGGLMKGKGNSFSSFSETFVSEAVDDPNSVENKSTGAFLAYQTYLLNQDDSGYFYTLANWETGLNQERTVTEKGGINEMVLSLGGNYDEKLMLGATLGIPFVNYSRDLSFSEKDATNDATNDFKEFTYNSNLLTTGAGVNLKLGMIYKPVDFFRLGIAVHTPTQYILSDVYNRSLTTNTEGLQGTQEATATEQRFNYGLSTPWRFILSGTLIDGKMGFITADYEIADYSSMRYRFEAGYKSAATARNNTIKAGYQSSSALRLGGELKMDRLALRAGYAFSSGGVAGRNSSSRQDYSAGLGFRGKVGFLDFAFVHSSFTQKEQPYNVGYGLVSVPQASVLLQSNQLAVTFGIKF
jgi:long-subunit fatty acid transport protein